MWRVARGHEVNDFQLHLLIHWAEWINFVMFVFLDKKLFQLCWIHAPDSGSTGKSSRRRSLNSDMNQIYMQKCSPLDTKSESATDDSSFHAWAVAWCVHKTFIFNAVTDGAMVRRRRTRFEARWWRCVSSAGFPGEETNIISCDHLRHDEACHSFLPSLGCWSGMITSSDLGTRGGMNWHVATVCTTPTQNTSCRLTWENSSRLTLDDLIFFLSSIPIIPLRLHVVRDGVFFVPDSPISMDSRSERVPSLLAPMVPHASPSMFELISKIKRKNPILQMELMVQKTAKYHLMTDEHEARSPPSE